MNAQPTFTDLKELLAKCGFADELLSQVLTVNAHLPASVEAFRQTIAAAYALQTQPVDHGGDRVITRRWRPLPETSVIIRDYLGIENESYARIRYNWVLSKEGTRLDNPDFHFINDVQSGLVNTELEKIDFLETASAKTRTASLPEWSLEESTEPAFDDTYNPPPEVEELTRRFSVNARTFRLSSYLPHKKTVNWLMQQRCIPKGFIFNRELIIDSFVSHINQIWLPYEILPKHRWRYVEQQFCQWVIDRYPKFCELDDEAAYQFATARYAKFLNWDSASLKVHLTKILSDGMTLRSAVDCIEEVLRNSVGGQVPGRATEQSKSLRDKASDQSES